MLDEALDRPLAAEVAGLRRHHTKREAVIAQLVERSANADLRAIKLLLDVLQKFERSPGAADAPRAEREDDVYAQLRAKLARLARAQAEAASAADLSESREGASSARKQDSR